MPEIKPLVTEYQRHRLCCPACKAWLWTFVARMFTVFTVRATREATALGDLLTEAFRGIVTCDRAKMCWRVGRLQWCWAHLKRDFQSLIDSGDG